MYFRLKLLLAIVLLNSMSAVSAGTTELISKASDGTPGFPHSTHSDISADGRIVVFTSQAENLVPGGISRNNIYVHDRETGLTEPVTAAFDGTDVNAPSTDPRISANGRFVVFSSTATNLVPNDTNGYSDVFVYDRDTGVTERVSLASNGAQGNLSSYEGSISADGRFVVFTSEAKNLVPNVTMDTHSEIYLHDRSTRVTERVSVASGGVAVESNRCGQPDISADGRFISFSSLSRRLVPEHYSSLGAIGSTWHVYVHDQIEQSTRIVSKPVGSIPTDFFSGGGVASKISADGRYVAFTSNAKDLVPDDNGTFHSDIFVFDQLTQTIEMVSRNSDGLQGNGDSKKAAISGDGRIIIFSSMANNLVSGSIGDPYAYNVFGYDRYTRTTEQINVTSDGSPADFPLLSDLDPWHLGLSTDGRIASFSSSAQNLVPESRARQVYVRVRDASSGVTDTPIRPDGGSIDSELISDPEPDGIRSNNIVVIVHGWQSSAQAWPEALKKKIVDTFDPAPGTRWSIATFDWTRAAFVPTTWFAYANAVDLGRVLGPQLTDFDVIHFIAHSAGSALVDSAAAWLELHADEKPFIHTTLLDAYHPFPELAIYGLASNWAEQYVDKRYEGFGLSNTNLTLRNAYNFDITSLDDRASVWPGIGSHEWPHVWYSGTLDNPTSWRYGWGASYAYDSSRVPSHSDLSRGGECIIVAPSTVCSEPGFTFSELQFSTVLNPFDIWQNPSGVQVTQSDTGTVSVSTPQQLSLTVGSPVWVTFSADVIEPFNALRFDYEYVSGVEGLLSVFLDDQLVFRSDQRNADEGLNQSGLVPLGEIGQGTHGLSFRLDHYSDSRPSIRIADITVGNASFVESTNIAPIARAGLDQNSTVGGVVELDGSESSDPDDRPLRLVYEWSQVSGTTVALRNAMSSNASFVVPVAGTYTFSLTVHDGHQASVPSIVRVVAEGGESTAPVISHSTSGPLGTNGWYLGDVTVSWIVNDGGAAISASSGCDPVTVSTETEGLVLVCTATNSVGTSSEQVEIRRDSTNPVIAISAPASGATYTQSTSVAANYSCTDSLSGIASCIGAIADGAPLDTSTVGSRSFSVNATDAAGNSASTQVTYQVVAAPEDSSGGGGGGGGALDHWTLLFLSIFGLGALSRRRQAH